MSKFHLKLFRLFRPFIVLSLVLVNVAIIQAPKANAATPGAPTITSISRVDGGLTVAFTAPTSPSPAITNYEYSTDGGTTWVARSPAATTSPISISGLTNCQTYSVSIRAVNSDGSGAAADPWNGVPGNLNYHLSNGLMKFGEDTQASIQNNGNLLQPWYKNADGVWKKMTFSSYPLNFGLAVGGDGTNEWNYNGSKVEFTSVASLSRVTIDCSLFSTQSTSGTLATGYGTLTVNGRYTFGTGEVVEITRSYTQSATSKYTTFRETIKNVGTSTMSNSRLWVGTQDDWIGDNDSNGKIRGNIVNGAFEAIATKSTQSKVLKIYNNNDTVYFYTTSNLGYTTGLDRYGSFDSQVMQKNPTLSEISAYNDGSYGMYLRFQDILPGASESFTWYYIASSAASADALLGTVASAALPGAPTIDSVTPGNSQASVAFTAGTVGGSSITNYQYSINGGTTWLTRSPASTSSPLVITGLQNTQTYDIKIRAVNSEGSGSESNQLSVTPIGTPKAPIITALTQTSNSVDVEFTAPTNDGGSTITNYEYSTNGGTTWTARSPSSTSTSFTIGGLSSGSDYEIVLRAVNAYGSGESSATQTITTHTTPSAPTISSITAGNQSLSVNFSLGSNGGTPITNIEYSINNGSTWVTKNPASTYSPLLITGLTNGTSYQIKIRAVNSAGSGDPSSSTSGTPITVPGPITIPSGTSATPSNQTLTISNFTAPNDGGSAITKYQYSTDRGATWKDRTDLGGTSTTSLVINLTSDTSQSLVNSTEYCVQLRAVNAAGAGAPSADICGTPATRPSPVRDIVTTSRDRAIDVDFTLGSNGGSAITDIEYCFTDCLTSGTWVSVNQTSGPFRVTGLTNGTQYTINIRVKNNVTSENNGYSDVTTASTSSTPATNPSAPTITSIVQGPSVSVSNKGNGELKVIFTEPTSDGGLTISGYQYSVDEGVNWQTLVRTSSSSPWIISGLTNGQTYPVTIRAVTAGPYGDASSIKYGTPSTYPSAPSQNVVVSPLNTRISVSFTEPSNGGLAITGYEYSLNGGSSWVSTNSNSTSISITGLTNGTAYPLQVRAINANGSGDPFISATSLTPKAVPESPIITSTASSLNSLSLSDKEISVGFTEPANNGSTITNYEYSTDGGLNWIATTGRMSPITISKITSGDQPFLQPATAYTIQIRAVNGNGSGASSSPVTVTTGGTADTVAPTVSSLTFNSGTTSASRTLTYTITFSEKIQWLVASDFTKLSGTATCSSISPSASEGTSITVTVTCSTDGTFQLGLLSDSIFDGANVGPVSASSASSVVIDTTAPTVTVSRPGAYSSTKVLSYSLAFSESVSGISVSDFVQSSGTASCSTTAVSASSGSSITFTVTCTNNGTVVMQLAADSVVDGVGLLGPTTATSASSVIVDTEVPTATFASFETKSASRTLSYTINFSESISGISTSDLTQLTGTATCSTTAVSASSGTSITFTVLCTNDGTAIMQLGANSITDGANNGPSSALTASARSIDTVIPTVSLLNSTANSDNTVIQYVLDFSENVDGISINDFVQESGTATCSTTAVSASSGTQITFSISCTTGGTVVMKLLSNSVSDGANLGPVSTLSTTELTVAASSSNTSGSGSNSSGTQNYSVTSIETPSSYSRSRILNFVVNFSESVTGIDTGDFIQTSGSANCNTVRVSKTSGVSTVISVSCNSDGNLVMQFRSNSVLFGSVLGPVNPYSSTEVIIGARNQVQPSPSPSLTSPSAKPSSSVSPVTRGPIYFNGELPKVTSSEPLTLISGIEVKPTTQPLPDGQEITLPTGVSVSVTAERKTQESLPPAVIPSGVLKVSVGDKLVVNASGLKPGSMVEVWLFSTPRLLGIAQVTTSGSISVAFDLGKDIPAGKHTAQVSAIESRGSQIAVNTGIEFIVVSSTSNQNYSVALLVVLSLSGVTGIFVWYGFRFRHKKADE